ncbi:hypothetical protein NA78x_005910 [Anatilimnocola sp. NA78]|uniref:hypothetical protein n=1 Tax=Anatilimnocola sp. NA78 TaxID=3415683 RepID=UPI003CE45624
MLRPGLLAVCGGLLLLTAVHAADDSIEVNVVGALATGLSAIGGETTGSTITAKGITWELDFGKDKALHAAAEKLSGQQVAVSGTLDRRAGVEVRERWIVTVKSLKGAAAKRDLGQGGIASEPKSATTDSPTISASETQLGTSIVIAAEGERTVIDVRCERGIDRNTIKRTSDAWPKSIVVRLRLKGLESFSVKKDNFSLNCSVPSSGEPKSHCELSSGNRQAVLEPADPLYLKARLVSTGKTEPKVPLENGYFEIELPAKLFADNPPQIDLQWVDFYR